MEKNSKSKWVPVKTSEGLFLCAKCGMVLERDKNGNLPDCCPCCALRVDWENQDALD